MKNIIMREKILRIALSSITILFASSLVMQDAWALPRDNEAEFLHEIEHMFDPESVTNGPYLVPCTLSGGTQTTCFSITVVSQASLRHDTGPWCPRSTSDTAKDSGIWLDGGKVHDVDGAFVANLAQFYSDKQWQLFDPTTGKVNVTDSKAACQAAARPDVDPAYQNYCVECLEEYMDATVQITYVLPIQPVMKNGESSVGPQTGVGVGFNGVRFDAPAPVDAILGAYTIAPFDDCGGHVNLHVGYHYHAVTGCNPMIDSAAAHAPIIGFAMDGNTIHTRANPDNAVPDDLDQCGGHVFSDIGYHYHANDAGANLIVGCFNAEQGCALENGESQCDAASTKDAYAGGGPPDFNAAAKALGVSEEQLKNALGAPPPDFSAAASILGITISDLEKALLDTGQLR